MPAPSANRGQTNDKIDAVHHQIQDVQRRVRDQVADYHHTLKAAASIEANRPTSSFWDPFHELWATDHVRTTAAFANEDATYQQPAWESIRSRLSGVLDRIKIKTINGSSDDVLDYYDHRNTGLYAIAIGGDKLSRD